MTSDEFSTLIRRDRRTPPMPVADAYREDLAYIHDTGHGSLARDAAAKLIEDLAPASRRDCPVVDLGCGSGILSQALTEAEYQVLGIDVSDAMVALARKRAPAAEFRVGSFVSSELPTCVAVTAIGEVLNYAFDPANDDAARLDLFRRVYRALVPGGVLLFDVASLERARPGRTFAEGDDWAVLLQTEFEPVTRLLTRTITSFRRVGTLYGRDTEVHRLTLVDPANVLESLHAIGFEAQTIPTYGAAPLPPGVVAFAARKR